MDDAMKELVDQAHAELDAAVKKWLKVKARADLDDDELEGYDEKDRALMTTSDPVLLGWITIATYTSHELELAEATATAYACTDGQPAPFSRGIAMSGVDRWRNY